MKQTVGGANESRIWADHLRGRQVRQLTSSGHFSQGQPITLVQDGFLNRVNFCLFMPMQNSGACALADPVTGDLAVLVFTPGHADVVEGGPRLVSQCHGIVSGDQSRVLVASRPKIVDDV